MKALAVCGLAATLVACSPQSGTAPNEALGPDPLMSGSAFLTPETRALQEDDFANPGFLWVDRGEALFHGAAEDRASCSSCHGTGGEALVGAAATYPKWDEDADRLMNLEGRINACRVTHQEEAALEYESDDLLALTAYVANLSKGVPVDVNLTTEAQSAFELGADYFNTRRGQFNLSCHQCHNDNWGRKLRGDTISQGHGNAFPAYRLEWQTLGSLHRRLSDCDAGVRAEPHALGSDTYVALEYYLAVRASGLEVETPGVRR